MPRCSISWRCSRACLAALCLLLCNSPRASAEDLGVRVGEEFEVSLYADDTLAHDIYSMTIDAEGRVVVAGAGYVKTLHDTDGDGRADRATLFSSVPASGAHGMVFDGPDLICTGDNAVMRLRDADRDGKADGAPEVWTNLRHPEHGANGIVRGPDGCYYLICGNDAGVSTKQITTATSPVKHPRSGGIVRFSAEGKPLDVFAHGFRNPYDLDFDAAGHLFTVDSDGERDHHLPWYAPTRLFDIAQGMEHGWLLQGWARGWNRPPSFFDSVERLVEIGRGSPTGVVAYRHHTFPSHYQGGVFAACWTLGRIYFFPLQPAGATCQSKLEVFLQTTGDVGFAPCDLAVGQGGELYVAIGGRRTRGSVFCVRAKNPATKTLRASSLSSVLYADQPLSSWSRAGWVSMAKSLGKAAFIGAVDDERIDAAARVRAIEVLVELFGGLDDQRQVERWEKSNGPQVRARVAWALGRGPQASFTEAALARLTADSDPAVQRAAWEALATCDFAGAESAALPRAELDWARALGGTPRRVRAAAIAVARGPGQASYRGFTSRVRLHADALGLRLADLWIKQPDETETPRVAFTPADVSLCLRAFTAADASSELRLEAVRLLQIALGDVRTKEGQAEVYSGYTGNATSGLEPASREAIVAQLAPALRDADPQLARELARLLGMLGAKHDGLLKAISERWTSDSAAEDDIHYLIVASLLDGNRSADATAATASALLRLHKKLDAAGQFPSRNWPFRLSETFDALCLRDPALAAAVVASPDFGHVQHTLFVERLSADARPAATRKLWAATIQHSQEPTSELIALVGKLPPDEALPLLRSQWDESGLRDAIVMALTKYPQSTDRAKFVEALASPQAAVVEKAARALVHLGLDCTTDEMASALRALKQACAVPKQLEPRQSLLKLLNFWTEENSDVDEDPDPAKVYVGWYTLFAQYYPAASARLLASSTADDESWRKRLAQVDWTTGDAQRGRAVFERRACHRCHQVSGHLGPELKGAVSRMSREDLFTAIVNPNLEVSPAYQTTLIATTSGQAYYGLVVYESPESTLLQTGPDTTVRVTNTEASSMRKSTQSLMPTGLLETLTDQDLGDLYAYLRTLAAK